MKRKTNKERERRYCSTQRHGVEERSREAKRRKMWRSNADSFILQWIIQDLVGTVRTVDVCREKKLQRKCGSS